MAVKAFFLEVRSMGGIAVTGWGAVSAWGVGLAALAEGASSGRSAVGELTLFAPPGRCERAAEAPAFEYAPAIFSAQPYLDRTTALSAVAAREALDQAGIALPVPAEAAPPVGVVTASLWGCMGSVERYAAPILAGKPRTAQGLVFTHSFPNAPASVLAIEFGLRGFSTVFAGSRLSGLWALRSAFDALSQGRAERLLLVAAEALAESCFAYAEQAGLVTARSVPRPFASDADGGIPGEGACALLLETAASAAARGAQVTAWLAEPLFAASPEGLPAGTAGEGAAVYACAPGIPALDRIEAAALERLGLSSPRALAALHGDACAVSPFFALAAAAAAGAPRAVVLQAGTDGVGLCRIAAGPEAGA